MTEQTDKFTTQDAIALIADSGGITKTKAKKVWYDLTDAIGQSLIDGDTVLLRWLGQLTVVERAARKCHNPKTGEPCEVGKRNTVKFKPSAPLKRAVN